MELIEECKEEFDEIDENGRLRLIEMTIKYQIKILSINYHFWKDCVICAVIGLLLMLAIIIVAIIILNEFPLEFLMPMSLYMLLFWVVIKKFIKSKNDLKNYDGTGTGRSSQTGNA